MRLVIVLAAVLLLAPAAAEAKPACTRGGAALEAAGGKVRVVRKALKRRDQRTRREALMACWTATGERKTILVEEDLGEDLVTHSQIEIVDGRYVGIVTTYTGGVSESRRAAVWDARTRKRLHSSRACNVDQGDFSGVDDVAFLPRGGMAMACRKLLLFRTGAAKTAEQLEADGVRSLAVTRHSHFFVARLYWSLEDGTLKFLDLS